jgi:hypothetical protein
MGSVVERKGRAKQPKFFGDEINGDTKSTGTSNQLPALIAIVAAGVALILFLRARSVGSRTGPLVVLTQSAAPDQSTIDNLTASVLALGALQHPPVTAPNPPGTVTK